MFLEIQILLIKKGKTVVFSRFMPFFWYIKCVCVRAKRLLGFLFSYPWIPGFGMEFLGIFSFCLSHSISIYLCNECREYRLAFFNGVHFWLQLWCYYCRSWLRKVRNWILSKISVVFFLILITIFKQFSLLKLDSQVTTSELIQTMAIIDILELISIDAQSFFPWWTKMNIVTRSTISRLDISHCPIHSLDLVYYLKWTKQVRLGFELIQLPLLISSDEEKNIYIFKVMWVCLCICMFSAMFSLKQ